LILYCIRHGETTYNAEGRLQGQSELPVLSDLGRRQSEATARALIGKPIEALYASPLRRAFETAKVIGRALQREIGVDPRLKEIDVGIFQGQLRRDLERDHAEAIARWLSGDPDYVIPGGESRRQLARRGLAAFNDIRQSDYEQAVVVAHGGLLVSTIKSLLGIPLQDPPLALENCSISTLAWHGDGRVELLAFNQVEHLATVGHGGIGDLAV
jgi:2,3-bisphosphoglycerate-dependent phosphoglycerate mutase